MAFVEQVDLGMKSRVIPQVNKMRIRQRQESLKTKVLQVSIIAVLFLTSHVSFLSIEPQNSSHRSKL